jgi:hypothetical protein
VEPEATSDNVGRDGPGDKSRHVGEVDPERRSEELSAGAVDVRMEGLQHFGICLCNGSFREGKERSNVRNEVGIFDLVQRIVKCIDDGDRRRWRWRFGPQEVSDHGVRSPVQMDDVDRGGRGATHWLFVGEMPHKLGGRARKEQILPFLLEWLVRRVDVALVFGVESDGERLFVRRTEEEDVDQRTVIAATSRGERPAQACDWAAICARPAVMTEEAAVPGLIRNRDREVRARLECRTR